MFNQNFRWLPAWQFRWPWLSLRLRSGPPQQVQLMPVCQLWSGRDWRWGHSRETCKRAQCPHARCPWQPWSEKRKKWAKLEEVWWRCKIWSKSKCMSKSSFRTNNVFIKLNSCHLNTRHSTNKTVYFTNKVPYLPWDMKNNWFNFWWSKTVQLLNVSWQDISIAFRVNELWMKCALYIKEC